MINDNLSGLGAELRKAAKTAKWIADAYEESLKGVSYSEENEQFRKRLWLPAALVAQDRRKLAKEYTEDLCEIFNNLVDDLQLDIPKGENGAASYEAAYRAIAKYTLKVLKEKIKKVEEAFWK